MLLVATCCSFPVSEREKQCLEMSQALVNVLSWKVAVPPWSPASRLPMKWYYNFIPSLDNMAGLCALALASGGVVLCFVASSEKRFN